jgi:hypothetical protein
MPDGFARAECADRLAFFVKHVRHDIDVGISGRALPATFLIWRRIELAKTPAEREKILVAEFLPPEEQYRRAVPSGFDLGKFRRQLMSAALMS